MMTFNFRSNKYIQLNAGITSVSSMKVMRRDTCCADRERPNAFGSEMNNTVLVLNSSFHLHKAFVQHDHRIEGIDVWHHNHVGMASLIFQAQKDEPLGGAQGGNAFAGQGGGGDGRNRDRRGGGGRW